MEIKQDIFSEFCTGNSMTDKKGQGVYESTPGFAFDSLLQELPFITLADLDWDGGYYTYALHSPEMVWGLLRLEMGLLRPFDLLTSHSHSRHIRQISTREDMRGYGFFKMAMESIVEVAEDAGIFLHGVSSPFHLKWPEINNSEEFLWFIRNERRFFGDQRSWKEMKSKSRKLLQKYVEYGCCRFRYPSGNGFARRWMRNNAGFGYLSSNCDKEMSKTLEAYLSC